MQEISHTINHSRLAHAKISGNAVQGRLSEKYLMRKLSHEIFWTQNICNLQ